MDCSPLLTELQQRGMLAQHTLEFAELENFLAAQSRTLYSGFDPSAESLQVGNLVPIAGLRRFQLAGHRPIALVGGATGMIGDPSGKSSERNLLDLETLQRNLAAQRGQLERLLDFNAGACSALLVNNYDWFKDFPLLDFLRDVGKNFRIGEMIAKESVKSRLETTGMSFTEFSYQLLQGYDFYHLYKEFDCSIQIGATDQWGNIVAGTELIRRKLGATAQAVGITFPLLTTASGAKFGKSAGNAVWLDARQTSPYQFYQFWLRIEDAEIEKYLKIFSFKTLDEIQEIIDRHQARPEKREAQRKLAGEVTLWVHGADGLQKAQRASEVLFGGSLDGFSDRELLEIFADVPSSTINRNNLSAGIPILELLVQTGLCASRGEAKKLIQNGGAYLNNQKIADIQLTVDAGNLAGESALVLRSGKKNYHLVRVE